MNWIKKGFKKQKRTDKRFSKTVKDKKWWKGNMCGNIWSMLETDVVLTIDQRCGHPSNEGLFYRYKTIL